MLSVICASAKVLLVFVAAYKLIDDSVFPCNCKTNNSNSLTRACKSSFSFFKMFISLVHHCTLATIVFGYVCV